MGSNNMHGFTTGVHSDTDKSMNSFIPLCLGVFVQLSPGYHDAPAEDKPMAIVFVKV